VHFILLKRELLSESEMDKETVISVDHVSKKYCKSLKRSMYYGAIDIGRNMFGLSSRSERLRKDEFWALDDISFEVKKGKTFGIIGPNGSGKTTLLKLLNGIFWPDKGKITIKGKVGALIELGAGFHPLLTGRENVYMNAAILGMTKKEVDKKMDEIVELADIGDFIDTPVKFYSSGMFVRLGFAVVAHCEPELLLVDEVLAVGDTSFQTKCLEKLGKLSRSNTTIIYVSHNLPVLRNLCDQAILLINGKVRYNGDSKEAVIKYYELIFDNKVAIPNKIIRVASSDIKNDSKKEVEIVEVKFLDAKRKSRNMFRTGEYFVVEISYMAHYKINNPVFTIGFSTIDGRLCAAYTSKMDGYKIKYIQGSGKITITFNKLLLLPDVFRLTVTISDEHGLPYDRHPEAYMLKVLPGLAAYGIVYLPHEWNLCPENSSISKNESGC
jgi:lipopolysaccharide transport system ATP-binding protein